MERDSKTRLSVSVIIPTYNRAAFIAAAIQSALDQTRPPDEILVIDDGSTDETSQVLETFGAPVRVIRQPNRGRSAARNAGIDATACDAFIFLDSDDLLMPACLERCAAVLEDRSDVGVVYSDSLLCDADGNTLARYSEQLPGNRPCGMLLPHLTRRNLPTISSMVRRAFVGEARFDESMAAGEDYDFWRQMSVRCPFWYIDEPLLRYRLHDAMSSGAVTKIMRAEIEVQRRIFQMPEFYNLPARTRSRAYCMHGIKRIVLGKNAAARRCFVEGIRTLPLYGPAHALLALSMISPSMLRYVILKRRQLSGNRLGTSTGLDAVREAGELSKKAATAVDTKLSRYTTATGN